MHNPDNEPQILALLKTLVEMIQQENVQLRQERADERLATLALRENLVNKLLPYLPAILPQLFAASSSSQDTSTLAVSLINLIESISADQFQEIRKILSIDQRIQFTQLPSLASKGRARATPGAAAYGAPSTVEPPG